MFGDRFLCASTILDASLGDLLDAAAAGRYSGLGLRPGHVRRGLSEHPDIAEALRARRLELVEIGFVSEWWTVRDGRPSSLEHERSLYELKDRYGARHMIAIGGAIGTGLAGAGRPDRARGPRRARPPLTGARGWRPGRARAPPRPFPPPPPPPAPPPCSPWGRPLPAPIAPAADRYRALCRRAADHDLTVALEFLPWSDVDTLEKAWRIVEASGAANAAIALDTWHFFRGGSTIDMLALVPAERIAVIQLSDGLLDPVEDELDATFRLRMLPGAGEFDLASLFRALGEKGVDAPIGIEVLSPELRALAPVEVGRVTGDAADAFFAAL